MFAYGPTGAGKTYTMLGTDKEPGVMVHTLKDLFGKSDAHCADMSRGVKHKVSLSYLEVYNENIRDLLSARDEYLDLREDPVKVRKNVSGLRGFQDTGSRCGSRTRSLITRVWW